VSGRGKPEFGAQAGANTEGLQSASLVRGLSLGDSTLLVIGGVIGSAIFLTPKDVAQNVPSVAAMFALWAFGGAIALSGALAVAELATMYPEAGGQYVYLREAYGDLPAFLFGWMMFLAGNGGGMATIATGFALYLGEVFPALRADAAVMRVDGWTLTRGHLVAISAIVAVCVIGALGVKRMAAWVNVTTWLKFLAMAVFVVLGFAVGHGVWSNFHAAKSAGVAAGASGIAASAGLMHGGFHAAAVGWGVALIGIFWAYDGWIYASWMGGEIREPGRNIPRALSLGIVAIAAIYLAMNAAFLYAIPMDVMAKSETVAQSAAVALFSPKAANWLSLMIAVSCFGALLPNASGGGRLLYAMAQDGLFFRSMARVHPKWRTPAVAIVAQCACGALLTLTGKYDELFTYTVFAMTLFYALTVGALFVLRRRNPGTERPYRCTGYPVVPAVYVLVTLAWTVNAVVEQPKMTVAGLVLLALGVPLYLFWKLRSREINPEENNG